MHLPLHLLRAAKYRLKGKWQAMQLPAGIVQNARGKLIICYHAIDYRTDTTVNSKCVSVSLFEQHLRYLKKYTNFITLKQYIEDDIVADKLNIAITFDDGFRNNYTLARPVLEKYNAPATFFITPIWHQGKNILWPDLVDHATRYAPDKITIAGEQYLKGAGGRFFHSSGLAIHQHVIRQNRVFIDKLYEALLPYATFMQKPDMDVYWQLMSPGEITALSSNDIFTIGSHTYTHTSLIYLDKQEAMNELTLSRAVLQDLIQKPVDYFAAPFGQFDADTIVYARNAGYTFQPMDTVDHSVFSDKDIASRFSINPYISAYDQLLFIANGHY